MKKILLLSLFLGITSNAMAKVTTQVVEYKAGETTCQGWLAYDAAGAGKRPGIVLFHDWLGATDHQKEQAEKLAAMGYVVLVADVYGKGVRPADSKAAGAEAGKYYGDPALLRARVRAAYDELAGRPQIDVTRLATTGYCFGGKCALELARSGAALKAVVTFHGSLATADPAKAGSFTPKVLVLHGADDPFVKQDEVKAFMDEMRGAKADWQVVQYSDAVHSFTDERSGTDNSKGAAYNANAARRSWRAMQDFLQETLAK